MCAKLHSSDFAIRLKKQNMQNKLRDNVQAQFVLGRQLAVFGHSMNIKHNSKRTDILAQSFALACFFNKTQERKVDFYLISLSMFVNDGV